MSSLETLILGFSLMPFKTDTLCHFVTVAHMDSCGLKLEHETLSGLFTTLGGNGDPGALTHDPVYFHDILVLGAKSRAEQCQPVPGRCSFHSSFYCCQKTPSYGVLGISWETLTGHCDSGLLVPLWSQKAGTDVQLQESLSASGGVTDSSCRCGPLGVLPPAESISANKIAVGFIKLKTD